jgi:S1-C subfamily serine protease
MRISSTLIQNIQWSKLRQASWWEPLSHQTVNGPWPFRICAYLVSNGTTALSTFTRIILSVCILVLNASAAPAAKRSLADRFASLSCAVVKIESSDGTWGTGFFVSPTGDVLTAAHVATDRSFTTQGINMSFKPGIRLSHNGTALDPPKLPPVSDDDAERAKVDLVVLKTGITSNCYLHIGNSDAARIGDNLLALAYPPSTPTVALYEGPLSARFKPNVPLTDASVTVIPDYDVFRVQIPVAPGASGAPVIGGNDLVIGVVVNTPVDWPTDLTDLLHGHAVDFQPFVRRLALAVVELTVVLQASASSGAGIAIPISNLTKWQAPIEKRTVGAKVRSSPHH